LAGRPGALLLVADFHRTLAAVRSLGRAGVDVAVADWRLLVPARWSRFARRTLTWSRWLSANAPHLIDAVIDRDDRLPAVVSAALQRWMHLSHPRATWRAVGER
jgi:hypothetical protein